MHRGIWLALLGAVMTAAGGCQDATDKLASPDPDVCVEGLRELSKPAPNEAVVRRVAEMVNHTDERISVEAIRSLGRMRAPQAAETIRRVAVSDSREIVRQEAVFEMGYENSPETLTTLRQAVKADADSRVRAEAATSLARLGSLEDVPLLIDIAEKAEDPVVASRAVGAVETLVGVKFGYNPQAPEAERRQALQRMRKIAPISANALRGRFLPESATGP